MNGNSRLAVWLYEHFPFFKQKPLFKDLTPFLQGKMSETILSIMSNDGRIGVIIESGFGKVSYEKAKSKVGKCVIEQVEFIPHESTGFAFTVVDNELSILRRNGSDPQYSPRVSTAEMEHISVFMNALRQKTDEFVKART